MIAFTAKTSDSWINYQKLNSVIPIRSHWLRITFIFTHRFNKLTKTDGGIDEFKSQPQINHVAVTKLFCYMICISTWHSLFERLVPNVDSYQQITSLTPSRLLKTTMALLSCELSTSTQNSGLLIVCRLTI